MTEDIFEIKYSFRSHSARIMLDRMQLKVGFKNMEIPMHSLCYLFHKFNATAGFEELILSYEKVPGKRKNIRIYANPDDPGLRMFIARLVKEKPEIDLRDHEETEAFQLLQVKDLERLAYIIAPLLILGIMSFLMLPLVIHGLDQGSRRISVSELAGNRNLETRNLTVDGLALVKFAVKKSAGSKGSSYANFYIPLVEADFMPRDEIQAILETRSLSSVERSDLAGQKTFSGVIRNILWEGLDGDIRDVFEKKMGLKLNQRIFLIEYQANPAEDLMIAIMVFSTALVMIFIIGIVLWYLRFRKNARK